MVAAGKLTSSKDSKPSLKSRKTTACKTSKGKKKAEVTVKSSDAGKKQKFEVDPLCFFRYDFLEDFLKKNPHVRRDDHAAMDAARRTANERWKSMSDQDKAPYVVRSVKLMKRRAKTARRAGIVADMLGNLKM